MIRRIAGVDYAHGGVDKYRGADMKFSGDDFSISTLEFETDDSNEIKGPIRYVHCWRHTGIESGQASYRIHLQNLYFNYDYIICDPGGGGLLVLDELKKPIQRDGANEMGVTPLITAMDLITAWTGVPKIILFSRADKTLKRAGLLADSESSYPNYMHRWGKKAIESHGSEIQFPELWPGWDTAVLTDPMAMRDYLNRQGRNLSSADKCNANIDLALAQLALVDKKMSSDGLTAELTKGELFQFEVPKNQKKDSAYSFLYAYFGVKIWQKLHESVPDSIKKKPSVLSCDQV